MVKASFNFDVSGHFTFMWNGEFFIETNVFHEKTQRNFVYSDATYGGEGDGCGKSTIRPFYGSYQDYLMSVGQPSGVPKGRHRICNFVDRHTKFVNS